MRLLKSQRGKTCPGARCNAKCLDALVAQSVIVLKSVILALPNSTVASSALPNPQRLVARLAKGLDGITNAKARASVYWLIGQYAGTDDNKGMGWDGVVSWVPDVLRKGVKGFAQEVSR